MSTFIAPADTVIQPNVSLGVGCGGATQPTMLGHRCVIRSGTTIYADVTLGDHVQTGHGVLIRDHTVIGNHVVIGTQSIIEGNVTIGDYVKIELLCYIPTHVKIGSRVFFGPRVTLTNDRYPLRQRAKYRPHGATIEDDVTIGAAAVILPGITIGRGSFVAAGAIVTKDVPPFSLAIGLPARMRPLPEKLREANHAPDWVQEVRDEAR